MPQPKLTPRIEKISPSHSLADLDGAPFTAREKAYLAGRLVKAVRLDFVRGEDSLPATKLFGVPFLPEEEDYPVCSACGAPLHNLFQVNFQEAGYNLLPECDLLVFYFCFQCNPLNSREPGWEIRAYREPEKKKPRRDLVLPPVPGQSEVVGMIFPVWEFCLTARYTHFADLPSGFSDQGIRANVTRNDLAHDRYAEYLYEIRGGGDRHVISKLGGWLEDLQDPCFTRCACGAELVHIVTIATDNYTPWVVGDIGALYLTGCPGENCNSGQIYWWANWT